MIFQQRKLKKLLQPAILKPLLKLIPLKNIHTDSFNKKMNMRKLLFVKPKDKKKKNMLQVMKLMVLIHQHGHPNIKKKLLLVMIHHHGDPNIMKKLLLMMFH
jgi:hypothetical protein